MKLRGLLFTLGLLQIPAAGCAQTKGGETAPTQDTAPLVLAEWNAYATRPTFPQPLSVAADQEGNVFLLDWVKGNVLRFTTDGVFVSSWKVPFPFHLPRTPTMNAIAASKGVVYVSDPAGACIHRFTTDGKHKGTLPFEATLNGLAVDLLGNLYVSGYQLAGVDTLIRDKEPGVPPDTLFTSSERVGRALWKVNRLGEVLNHWDRRTGALAVDHKGILFAVTELYPDGPLSILRLDPAGGRISEWEFAKFQKGPPPDVNALAVDQRGHVFLTLHIRVASEDEAAAGAGSVKRRAIVELDATGNWTRDWIGAGRDHRPIVQPTGVAVDTSGCLYVTDFAVSRVVKYDPRKTP